MKLIIAYCLSWGFFWIGDITSKVLDFVASDDEDGTVLEHMLYNLYQKSMFASNMIQDWGCPDAGPWEEVDLSKLEENGEKENVHQPQDRN